jgi:predicted RNA methylase
METFFLQHFNVLLDDIDIDFDQKIDKKYIFFNEFSNKKGSRYDSIINNNLNINDYSTHSPSCVKLYDVLLNENITNNDSIIDIGSGKGFALSIFSLFNFKKITGIEISQQDHLICEKNMTKLNIYNKVNIINDNILNFKDYNDYNYFYFYNPFGVELFENIINNIINCNKNITIIYKNIHEEELCILNKYKFTLYKKYPGLDREYYIFKYNFEL